MSISQPPVKRNDLKAARSSRLKISGCSQAAEVAAFVNLVPVDEVAERAVTPASRRRVDLGRENGDGDREFRDVDGIEWTASRLCPFPG